MKKLVFISTLCLVIAAGVVYSNHANRIKWDAEYQRTLSSYQHLHDGYGNFDLNDGGAFDTRLHDFEHNTDDLVAFTVPYYGRSDQEIRKKMLQNLKDCGSYIIRSRDDLRMAHEAIRNRDRNALRSASDDMDSFTLRIAFCALDGNPRT